MLEVQYPQKMSSTRRSVLTNSETEARSMSRQRSSVFSKSSRSNSSDSFGTEERIIEEKRKRASGDGYSVHKYTLGRMLGKGGFAKVYLCTAMDTGKNYAVKVVPKANLVKARARQKVCEIWQLAS